MSREIRAVLRRRSSVVALAAADGRTRITCGLRTGWHFHSASIVKVLILATLLHDLAVRHEHLSHRDVVLTTEMITESDNDAATALWDADGIANLRHFLDLARMRHTVLGVAHWGLTEVTAQDEMTLLRLLAVRNRVLDRPSRGYALKLMADVIPSQRWGVPAGVPAGVKVHLKNGWLPDPELWVINSIGVFTQPHRVYRIVILTRDNPDMDYGVDTVQDLAEVINRGYNPGRKPAVAPSRPFPSWGTPDEVLPG
jgi:beta-lactamase class A